jgi:molybdopterin-containing oxidoreductase family membrane subunit
MTALSLTKAHRKMLFRLWIVFLIGLMGVGLIAGIQVLMNGLGVTNLTDKTPWGLWIIIDISSIALGAGAFTLSAAVYVFGLKRYATIARVAVFVGILGYTSAMLALLMDIGRPDRFYHPLIYWNVHSVLWEITVAVVFYTSVLVLELLPIIIESTPLKRIRLARGIGHLLHQVMPIVALVGMGISMIHQSSLGATYGILTARPVWYSPSAPVLFILSAVAAGPALTVFLTLVVSQVLGRQMVPRDVLHGVIKFIGFACLAYLYLKLWSWAASFYYSSVPERDLSLQMLTTNTPYGFTFWWGEVFFGAFVPAVIFLWSRLRRHTGLVMIGALLVILGLVLNRWNVTLSGFAVPLDWSPGVREVFSINTYAPALVEWGVALGILGYAMLAFTLGVRYLNLYPYTSQQAESIPHDVVEPEVRASSVASASEY